MTMRFVRPALLLCLFCGCARETTPRHSQIPSNVIEGVGIPGHLEIGIRMDRVPDEIPSAKCEPNSRRSLTWWFGETWRKHPPWGKPANYRLEVPSMGVWVIESHPTNEITQIHFMAKKEFDWPYFSGTLSSGLHFSGTEAVAFSDVTALYGETAHTSVYTTAADAGGITNAIQRLQEEEAILQSGESLLMTHDIGHPYRLHYPARGIYFIIQNGTVHSFRIFKKVEPPAAQTQPEGAP